MKKDSYIKRLLKKGYKQIDNEHFIYGKLKFVLKEKRRIKGEVPIGTEGISYCLLLDK